ncbi:MAG: hypothetical protein J5I59_01020 [Saprospiraceae bacterium]|nr:hypothetical protein [Saprospiraceae bacterium]
MKYLSLLMLTLGMSFVACKSEQSKDAKKDEAEAYVPYDGKQRQIAYTDTVVNNKGIQFELTFRGGSIDGSAQVKVRKDGVLLENKDRRADGRVSGVFLKDINGDGEDDFLFYTNTEDVTKIGHLYGVIHTGNEIKHIYVSPFLKAPYVDNYLGRDSFYIENGIIYKSFPKFDFNKLRQKINSGKRWVISYPYKGTDTIAIGEGVLK